MRALEAAVLLQRIAYLRSHSTVDQQRKRAAVYAAAREAYYFAVDQPGVKSFDFGGGLELWGSS